MSAAIATAPHKQQMTTNVQNELTKSFSSAAEVAKQYPQYAKQITAGAKASFLAGDQWAYTAGIVAVLLGTALVFFLFPRKRQEQELLGCYHAEDTGNGGSIGAPKRQVRAMSPSATGLTPCHVVRHYGGRDHA